MVVMATRHPDRQPLARRKPWPLPSFTSPGFMTLISSRPPSLVLAEPLEGQDFICHIMRRVWLLLALKNKSHLCLIRPPFDVRVFFLFFSPPLLQVCSREGDALRMSGLRSQPRHGPSLLSVRLRSPPAGARKGGHFRLDRGCLGACIFFSWCVLMAARPKPCPGKVGVPLLQGPGAGKPWKSCRNAGCLSGPPPRELAKTPRECGVCAGSAFRAQDRKLGTGHLDALPGTVARPLQVLSEPGRARFAGSATAHGPRVSQNVTVP